jgi:hypothetical protein
VRKRDIDRIELHSHADEAKLRDSFKTVESG